MAAYYIMVEMIVIREIITFIEELSKKLWDDLKKDAGGIDCISRPVRCYNFLQ